MPFASQHLSWRVPILIRRFRKLLPPLEVIDAHCPLEGIHGRVFLDLEVQEVLTSLPEVVVDAP